MRTVADPAERLPDSTSGVAVVPSWRTHDTRLAPQPQRDAGAKPRHG